MKALGREERGEVRTFLGAVAERNGPAGLVEMLASVCDVVFCDTRPLFAHGGRRVSESDRFASDLGRVEDIEDPWVREFTEAAVRARVPFVLGGHTLVSGGLWLLAEQAAQVQATDTRAGLSSPRAN